MIPVIGVPVLCRGDLLLRCIRSIDYPVGQVIIVNHGNDETVAAAIEQLQAESGLNIRVSKPPVHPGLSASWNWMMQSEPAASYWLLVSDDIEFAPGDLERIDEHTRSHTDWAQATTGLGYALFVITQVGLKRIGYFDENFYPAYWEDLDHLRRLQLSKCKFGVIPDVQAIHGEAPNWGSSTINSDPTIRRSNEKTWAMNFRYFQRKWHCGQADLQELTPEDGWKSPYGDAKLTLRDWVIDQRMAAKNGNPLPTRRPSNAASVRPWRLWRSYGYEFAHRLMLLPTMLVYQIRRVVSGALRQIGHHPPAP